MAVGTYADLYRRAAYIGTLRHILNTMMATFLGVGSSFRLRKTMFILRKSHQPIFRQPRIAS